LCKNVIVIILKWLIIPIVVPNSRRRYINMIKMTKVLDINLISVAMLRRDGERRGTRLGSPARKADRSGQGGVRRPQAFPPPSAPV
jgi:hypothetical protein